MYCLQCVAGDTFVTNLFEVLTGSLTYDLCDKCGNISETKVQPEMLNYHQHCYYCWSVGWLVNLEDLTHYVTDTKVGFVTLICWNIVKGKEQIWRELYIWDEIEKEGIPGNQNR